MTLRTSSAFGALVVILLIAVVGIAALYAIRAQMPSTTASSTASPTSTATLPTATSTPIQTVPAKTNDPIAQPSAAASPGPPPDPSSVPDQVTIDARSYRIAPASAGGGTYLGRDFMPVSPPGGRPLMAFVEVIAEDGGVFPEDITVDRIWIYGPTVWDTAPAEVRRAPEAGTPPDQIEVIARDGPKWEPGIEVDLVLRLRFGAATYFLRLTSVAIERAS